MTNSAPGFPIRRRRIRKKPSPTCIEDLAKGRPMDRLVCGDVGFGKTEVALRAAFVDGDERAAGRGRRADHAAGAPAFSQFRRALRGLSGEAAPAFALRRCEGGEGGQGGAGRRRCRHRRRHPCAARQEHRVPQSRPRHRRRGAAFRRRPQGAAEGAEGRCPCADADRDADPAHLAARALRRARSLADHHAADRPPGGAHLRHAVRSADVARGVAARALSRRAELLCVPAHRRSARGDGIPESHRAGGEARDGAWPDGARRRWKT